MSDTIPSELALEQEPFDELELDAALEHADAGDELEPATEAVVRWLPANRGAAEWAARKLRELEQQHAAVTADAAEWHRQIDAWRDAQTKRLERRSLHFQGALIGYVRALIDADPKQGTLALPSGAVRVTRRQPRVAIDDRELVAESALAHLSAADVEQCVKTPPPPKPVADARAVAKLAKIVERPKLRCWRLELEGDVCVETILPADVEPPAVGDVVPYDDGIDERELELVALSMLGESCEPCAVWADSGHPIEGARVEPGRIDFTVET